MSTNPLLARLTHHINKAISRGESPVVAVSPVPTWTARLQETEAEIAAITGPNRAAFLREIHIAEGLAPSYLATMRAQARRLKRDIANHGGQEGAK